MLIIPYGNTQSSRIRGGVGNPVREYEINVENVRTVGNIMWSMRKKEGTAILLALLAAVCYSINIPLSKILLEDVGECMMAGFLYLGAGLSIGILSLFENKKTKERKKLTASDMPYVSAMVVLDIAAPVLLMLGLRHSSASLATLVNNFEIVATSLIACVFFHETISKRGWAAIALISAAAIVLSLSFEGGMEFSTSLLLVLLATICWGFENNCTRMISGRDTYEIVFIKGIFSGLGSIILALITGETFPLLKYILLVLALGSVAYGLSIFFYIRAQNTIGASRTSSFYAVNPFIGSLLSFFILRESITIKYVIALAIMAGGTSLMVRDTLSSSK